MLGEFNKNSADPEEKAYEVLRATAYKVHTYSHTTMGFIEDIEDMPNQYDYSLQFYGRYYRPEYATIVMVGDLKRDEALGMVKKYFVDWKRGSYQPDIPSEPDQKETRESHVDWPSETLPLVYSRSVDPHILMRKKTRPRSICWRPSPSAKTQTFISSWY